MQLMVWDNTYGDFYPIEFTEINNTKVRIIYLMLNYLVCLLGS